MVVHQLLALTLQLGAISADRCWEQLSWVPDFRGISRAEFDLVVERMKKEEFLFESGGLLSMGEKADVGPHDAPLSADWNSGFFPERG